MPAAVGVGVPDGTSVKVGPERMVVVGVGLGVAVRVAVGGVGEMHPSCSEHSAAHSIAPPLAIHCSRPSISHRGDVFPANSQQPSSTSVGLAPAGLVGVTEGKGPTVNEIVGVTVTVEVARTVGVGVHAIVRVRVGERVTVAVREEVNVKVGEGVSVGDRVRIGENVGEFVGVGRGVSVRVAVGVRVRVRVAVTVGVKGTPDPLKTKCPVAVDLPATTSTTLWPTKRSTRTRDWPPGSPFGSASSLHANSAPEHVPNRTANNVSKSEPSVLNSKVPENGAV